MGRYLVPWGRDLVWGILLAGMLGTGCVLAQPNEVQLGMSEDQVVQLLGPPDRKAVLQGKVLRDAEHLSAADRARLRLVYIYDPSGLQVWFQDGKVTGVTRHGVSVR